MPLQICAHERRKERLLIHIYQRLSVFNLLCRRCVITAPIDLMNERAHQAPVREFDFKLQTGTFYIQQRKVREVKWTLKNDFSCASLKYKGKKKKKGTRVAIWSRMNNFVVYILCVETSDTYFLRKMERGRQWERERQNFHARQWGCYA